MYLSRIEQELSTLKYFEEHGIRSLLLDLDGTIGNTQPPFSTQMDRCGEFLMTKLGPILNWRREIEVGNNLLYESMGVSPDKWNIVINSLHEQYEFNQEIASKAKEILANIYTTPITFMPGAEKVLNFLKNYHFPFGIVTHASEDWTWKKYNDWLNLSRFLPWEDIFTIKPEGHKDKEAWIEAFSFFKTNPEHTMIVGDSEASDIKSSHEAGAEHLVLVEGNSWSIQHCEIPPTTRRISTIDGILYFGSNIVFSGILRR